jgi:AraC-like DNA-binding protein
MYVPVGGSSTGYRASVPGRTGIPVGQTGGRGATTSVGIDCAFQVPGARHPGPVPRQKRHGETAAWEGCQEREPCVRAGEALAPGVAMVEASMGRVGGRGGEASGRQDLSLSEIRVADRSDGAAGPTSGDRCEAARTTSKGRTQRVARAAWAVLAQGELPATWRASLEGLGQRVGLPTRPSLPGAATARRGAPGERAVRDKLRRLIGLTPRELSTCLRLVDVIRRVCVPDVQLKRVAFEMGFRDPAALSRFVTRYTGASPSVLRRRLNAGAAAASSALPVRQSSTA